MSVIFIAAAIISIEELVLERIYYPDTRATRFPGVIFSLLDVMPVITILAGFKFAWDASIKQREVDELRSSVKESELQFLKSQINPHFLFNNLNNLYIKIDVTDIRFIQSDADYTEIFTAEKKYLSQEPLRYWEEYLNSKKFIRIHKSYILNISKVQKIASNQVRLDEKTNLPIGRAYKDSFMEHIIK